MNTIEKRLADLFAKLPPLPAKVKDVVVQVAPYWAILGVVLGLPAVLALLGLSALATPIMAMGGMWAETTTAGLAIAFIIAGIVLDALAIPGLFARKAAGWRFLYWGALLAGLHNLLSLNLYALIIGTGVTLYLLFQVKERYR